jgi:diguanylate cyclase (GGDEF)-like protein
MSLIDIRTVFLLCGVMGGLMSLVLFSLSRNYPPTIRGLADWSGSLGLLFVTGVLTAGRDLLPNFVSVSLSNVLFFLGLYWGYVGTQRFFGEKTHHGFWLAVIATMVGTHLWVTHVHPSLNLRLVVFNLSGALFMSVHAGLIFKYRPISFAKGLTLAALTVGCILQLGRVVLATRQTFDDNILGPSPIHQIYATGFAFSILVFSIGVILMATEKLRAELEHLATRDSLTNALTRRHWNTLCESELERCKRSGRNMAILALDLDHFKAVNDTFGHQAGDKVLVRMVANVNGHLRQNDRLARFGGEEFVVLLPETDLEQARNVAERIRVGLADSGEVPSCTASIGIATNNGQNDSVDSLLARADAAMYRAKETGRNRVESN